LTGNTAKRAHTSPARVAWRQTDALVRPLSLAVRLSRRAIKIDPTCWVAARSVIGTWGGGTSSIGKYCEDSRQEIVDACATYLSMFAPAMYNDWTRPRTQTQIERPRAMFRALIRYEQKRAVT